MSAIDKTNNLKTVKLPLSALVPNATNPNKMGNREFDLLCDNIERTGLTEPILVKAIEDGKYRIVGGHHRHKAAQFLGFEEVPCVVIDDPQFDEEAETFQLVRMNTIHGKLDPDTFFTLYQKMSAKYSDEILQDSFGFAEEADFKKLVRQVAKDLPNDMKKKFLEAANEVKTIDGLSKLLNSLFSKYGDTLPHGYMVFDYGGQQSVWLRMSKKTYDALGVIGDLCVDKRRTMDDVVGALLQSIAKGELKDAVDKAVTASPEVELPEGLQNKPTLDNIQAYTELG